MTRYDNRVKALAACLSALAGYVDAVGFMELGGFFVSFMSGNSTRLGVGLGEGSREAAIAGALIAAFVAGVILGSFLGRATGARRRPAVLLMVALLLAVGAAAGGAGAVAIAAAAIALAMGAENMVFEREGEVSIGLTYMTGTLVRFGQRAAGALMGDEPLAWLPYLLLWLGLVGGAVAGAAAYLRLGLNALWLPAAAGLLLAIVAWHLGDES